MRLLELILGPHFVSVYTDEMARQIKVGCIAEHCGFDSHLGQLIRKCFGFIILTVLALFLGD